MGGRWLALAVIIPMTGCMGSELGGSSDYYDDGRTVIAEDQYYSSQIRFNVDVQLTLEIEVHSGPNVDVLVMDELNFQQYRNGRDFVQFSSCGGVAAQGFTRTCSLTPDDYAVVIDNTDAGNTAPPFNALDDGADVSWIIQGVAL